MIARSWIIFFAISLYASTFFITRTNLVTSDLGRHIMNGKLVLLAIKQPLLGDRVFEQALHDSVGFAVSPQEWKQAVSHPIFTTNAYSYTNPEFGVLNHHWLFGVLVYLVFLGVGFSGLTILNAVIVASAVGIALHASHTRAHWKRVGVVGLFLLPLVLDRTEIRPESMSLLFGALYFLLLSKVTRSGSPERTHRWMITGGVLFLLQLIWVNTHIFFILGIGIWGAFWLESIFLKQRQNSIKLSVLGIILLVASLLNPSGLTGALAPLGIFGNYDFLVAENQNTFFMLRILPSPRHWYYLFLAGTLSVAGGVSLLSFFRSTKVSGNTEVPTLKTATTQTVLGSKRSPLVWGIYITALLVAGLWLNRLYSFFGLLALPPLAWLGEWLWQLHKEKLKKIANTPLLLPLFSLCGFAILWIASTSGLFFPPVTRWGVGILPENLKASEFFITNKLQGPVFNNYDIGGYLIFTIFPHERVYTDNRPEAYPPDFFTTFKQVQADPSLWEKLVEQEQFSTIYFHRHDLTDHGQQFLIERIKDPEWAPVFVDASVLILVRRTVENEKIITHYELPPQLFNISLEGK
jgi:hypothetical protein